VRLGSYAVLGVIALVVVGAVAASRENGSRKRAVAAVVKTFIQARDAKNGALACAQLTPGAQRDMVALVTRVPASSANAADCPRYIVRESSLSRFTRNDLGAFGDGDSDVSVQKAKAHGKEGDWVARARPAGSREPDLPAWNRDGQWKLDGFAMIGAGVVLGCKETGQSKQFCYCMFDSLRDQNPGSPNQLLTYLTRMQGEMQAGRAPATIQQAGARCQAYAGRA
jgi:hypothetical protein